MMVAWEFPTDWTQNKIDTWKATQVSDYPKTLDQCSLSLTHVDFIGNWTVEIQPWSLSSVPYKRTYVFTSFL